MIKPGDIVRHEQFEFADGETADKYLLVLAADLDVILVAKMTSKGRRYRNDHGCQSGNAYPAFLLTQGCCCMSVSTWVCLSDFYELRRTNLVDKLLSGAVVRYGALTPMLARDVQVCSVGCDDITQEHERFVRNCFVDDNA